MKSHPDSTEGAAGNQPSPQLVNRRANRESAFRMGRTIGEKREKIETKSERSAARKKDKKRQICRMTFTVVGLIVLVAALIALVVSILGATKPSEEEATSTAAESYSPTIEIIDEATASSGNTKITSRMETYIGQLERDLKDLGYQPVKAVIPSRAVREVDIYIAGYDGFFKTVIDRDSAVTAEDIDRMIRYLAGQGISSFEYIDVRVAGKAYWK